MCVKNVCLGMSLLMYNRVCECMYTIYGNMQLTFRSIPIPFLRNDLKHCMV